MISALTVGREAELLGKAEQYRLMLHETLVVLD